MHESVHVDARNMTTPEQIRDGVAIIKEKFLHYQIPELQLPADSVIEDCVKEILALSSNGQETRFSPG